MKFNEMKIGDVVEFPALLEDLKLRYTPNQTSYYSANLSDGTDTVDARIWDINLKKDLKNGTVYLFNARINEYGGKRQFVITQIRDIEESEINLRDFYRYAPIDEAELRAKIKEYIRKITNPILYKLVVTLIKDAEPAYFTYPAATSMHHNYLCGLAYHTYSMARLADQVLVNYPMLNSNLLYAGILLHDIGKTKELSNNISPVYTMDGMLLGHIVIGLNMISNKAKELGYESTEEVQMLLHMIAAHHGELEYGSPKEPATIEALALHLIDLMDSKLASVEAEYEKTPAGEMTQGILSLGKKNLYKTKIDKK